jgi:crotonobetainyl-CoA:carnitine CoA-transferase CaiB-like acyl-CoA transferase
MGYGPATAPLTGLSAVTGYVGGGPEELGLSMPDPNAGMAAALAIVAALERRDRTGEGDHLDVSLVEATGALGLEAWMQYALAGTQPQRQGNRDPHMAPHGVFACAGDDEWISIACTGDAEWRRLAEAMDPALAREPRFGTLADRKSHEDELEALVSGFTRQRDRWDLTRSLQALGIAAFPTLSCRDIVEDPHLNARGFIERLPHPEVGARAHTGVPWRLRARPDRVRSAAPCLGAHTDAVLRRILGYGTQRIAALREAGVLY